MTQTLAEIWHKRLLHARNTKKANRAAAERAVGSLYETLGRATPAIHWAGSPNTIKGEFVHRCTPLNGILELTFLDAWHRLPEPEALALPLGFDVQENTFAIAGNYSLIWRNIRLRDVIRGQSPRPAWMRIMRNLVTQFDGPQLSFIEYAAEDSRTSRIGQALRDVLQDAFGLIMFTKTCVLFERPRVIGFDDTHMLSSTTAAALEWRDRRTKIFAVNGILVQETSLLQIENYRSHLKDAPTSKVRPLPSPPDQMWYYLVHQFRNAAERVAVIEMLGWEQFLDLSVRMGSSWTRLLSKDKYGELWRVLCGNQTLMMVKVINKTAEPDGSFRPYVIPVDPRLRPIPNPRDPNGTMGKPQFETALNAVASTFGMTGEQYAEILGKES